MATALTVLMPASAGAAPTVMPTSLDFGNQQIGTTSAPQPTTISTPCTDFMMNPPPFTGGTCISLFDDSLTVNITATGDFTVVNEDCPGLMLPDPTTGAAAACTANVAFTPTAPGARSGTLMTGTTGPGGGLSPGPTVSLSGTGTTPSGGGIGGGGSTPGGTTGSSQSPGSGGVAGAAQKCKKKSKRAASAKKKSCKKKRK